MRVMAMLLGLLGLAACGPECPPHAGIEGALYEAKVTSDGMVVRKYRHPVNAWARNPGMEAFLRDALQSGGVPRLRKYGMQCSPHPAAANCADCSSCSMAFPGKVSDWSYFATYFFYAPTPRCVDSGEMFVNAEIGPGDKVHAMTYWKYPLD